MMCRFGRTLKPRRGKRQVAPGLVRRTAAVLTGCLCVWGTVGSAVDDVHRLSLELQAQIEAHASGEGLQAFQLPDNNDYDAIPQDPSNPITRAKVRLGKLLFHETAVATLGTDPERNETWSCASCHHVAAGFKSGVPQGIGDGGTGFGVAGEERVLVAGLDATAPAGDPLLPDLQPLASPTILNAAWQMPMLWNGSFGNLPGGVNSTLDAVEGAGPAPIKANTFGLAGLETQALAGTHVHRLAFDNESVLQRNGEYRHLFERAFPGGVAGVIPDNGTTVTQAALGAALAIAAYERTVVSNLAPFQKWLAGDRRAMSKQSLRGALLFFGKADCVACHTGPALSSVEGAGADDIFFAVGFADLDPADSRVHGIVDEASIKGRGGFTGDPADDYKFKVPPLYNLTDSDVFGHGASFASVREVIEYKNAAVAQNPASVGHLSPRFVPLGLDADEVDDLVAFVEQGLHDRWLDRYVPTSLPSDSCFPVADLQSAIDLDCLTGGDSSMGRTPVCLSAASDPDGDGWGWENHASCRVDGPVPVDAPAQAANGHPICLSSHADPDGDGWGWENERSCRVGQVQEMSDPQCRSAASDSDGDGWGWENQRSCRVF